MKFCPEFRPFPLKGRCIVYHKTPNFSSPKLKFFLNIMNPAGQKVPKISVLEWSVQNRKRDRIPGVPEPDPVRKAEIPAIILPWC